MSASFQIAIDGPVAAGKGTVARLLAQRLGWLYVDTGAMYRAAALLAVRAGVPLEDGKAVAKLVAKARFEMKNPQGRERDGRLTTLIVNDEDVSWEIRREEFSHGSSVVAVEKEVREVLVRKQQEIAGRQNVVMEGRDITFRVLPDAQLRIFLTASEEERARRRQRQLEDRGEPVDYAQVLEELKKRDVRDSSRKTDPMHVTPDVWLFDTTDLTVEEVVEKIIARYKRIIKREK